jgi:hypothetical protein
MCRYLYINIKITFSSSYSELEMKFSEDVEFAQGRKLQDHWARISHHRIKKYLLLLANK